MTRNISILSSDVISGLGGSIYKVGCEEARGRRKGLQMMICERNGTDENSPLFESSILISAKVALPWGSGHSGKGCLIAVKVMSTALPMMSGLSSLALPK